MREVIGCRHSSQSVHAYHQGLKKFVLQEQIISQFFMFKTIWTIKHTLDDIGRNPW